jgi:NADH dehydrogenase
MEASSKKTYHLGGVAYYWKDIIQTIAKAYGKKKWTIPAPAIAIQIVASLLGRFSWFPITKDQLTMLVEGNVCESDEIFELFKIEPTPFNTETLSYLNK